MHGERVDHPDDLAGALRAAFAHDGSALVEVMTARTGAGVATDDHARRDQGLHALRDEERAVRAGRRAHRPRQGQRHQEAFPMSDNTPGRNLATRRARRRGRRRRHRSDGPRCCIAATAAPTARIPSGDGSSPAGCSAGTMRRPRAARAEAGAARPTARTARQLGPHHHQRHALGHGHRLGLCSTACSPAAPPDTRGSARSLSARWSGCRATPSSRFAGVYQPIWKYDARRSARTCPPTSCSAASRAPRSPPSPRTRLTKQPGEKP